MSASLHILRNAHRLTSLFLLLLAIVIATGYYHLQGRWVELWMSSGQVLRYCIPLTLNNRDGYHTDGTATTFIVRIAR
jgi:hypothetical protein